MPVLTSIGVALGATGIAATAVGAGVVGGVAAAGFGLAGLMSGGSKQKQLTNQMPSAPSAPKLEDASKAAQMKADERKRAMARSKSVHTSPLGLKDEANVARKKLLGG